MGTGFRAGSPEDTPTMRPPASRTNHFTVIAQDPGVRSRDGRVLTASVRLPPESLRAGPRGYRVHVIDFDTTTDRFYPPLAHGTDAEGGTIDPFADADPDALVAWG
jgi:hypothetical protein